MALGYAWFDSYDSVGYVLTLHSAGDYPAGSGLKTVNGERGK